MWLLKRISLLTIIFSLFQCSVSPKYDFNNPSLPFLNSKPITFLSSDFDKANLDCLAILPLQISDSKNIDINKFIDIDKLFRQTIYAHTAPYQYQDIELAKIDYFLKENDLIDLSEKIKCQNFITGNILAFSKKDYKIYSNIFIHLELELKNISSSNTLWKSEHMFNSHGGTIPLSPIGIAFGLVDAAKNLEDQQYIRIADEVVRAMILTLPDSEQNLNKLDLSETEQIELAIYKNDSNKALPNEFNEEHFRSMLDDKYLSHDVRSYIYIKLIENLPNDVDLLNNFNSYLYEFGDFDQAYENTTNMIVNNKVNFDSYILRGQLALKLNNLKEAEKTFIKASAINNENSTALNALGYVYTVQENFAKAEAAYLMALKVDPNNSYTNSNLAKILSSTQRVSESLKYYKKAAEIYFKNKKYGKFQHILSQILILQNQNHEVGYLSDYLNSFDFNLEE